MPRLPIAVLAVFLLVGSSPSAVAEPIAVFVSIPPQAYLVERIGGGEVRCSVLLPPGTNPHTYDIRPTQILELARAKLYVRIGVAFETTSWNRIRDANPAMRLIEGCEHSNEHEERASHHQDPHCWLDPRNMIAQAREIAAALRTIDPDHAPMYQINAEALIKDLETLDRDIRDRLAPLRGRTLWVVHPSWGYFAEAYGLVQRAVEHEGKEPGPKRLVQLIAEMKRQGARVIFTDPQFSDKTARLIAREAGADVKPLDTLAHNYLENLRNAMDVIAGSI